MREAAPSERRPFPGAGVLGVGALCPQLPLLMTFLGHRTPGLEERSLVNSTVCPGNILSPASSWPRGGDLLSCRSQSQGGRGERTQ